MGFHTLDSSALIAVYSFWSSGTSSSAKIASTGHSATHSVQSMHSSGSMTSMFGPSRKQSTGHTSTQSVYLHFTQASVTTYAMKRAFRNARGIRRKDLHFTRGRTGAAPASLPARRALVYDGCTRRG